MNLLKIVSVEKEKSELLIHTLASGEAVTLSVTFPIEGGVRLCDANPDGQSGIFAPASVCDIHVISDTNGLLKAQGIGSDTSIELDYKSDAWKLAVCNEDDTVAYLLTADDLSLSYENGQRISVSLSGEIAEGELFIGSGERYSGVVLNGKSYELWNKDCWSNGTDSYVNIPLFHSNMGYSFFFPSYYRGNLDLGEAVSNRFELTFQGPDLDIYFWTGTPLANLQSYAKLTGTPVIAPRWALRYWAGGTTAGFWAQYKKPEEDRWNYVTGEGGYRVLTETMEKYRALGTMPGAVFTECGPSRYPKAYDFCKENDVKLLGWWHPDAAFVTWALCMYDEDVLTRILGDDSSTFPIIHQRENPNEAYRCNGHLWIDFTHPRAKELVANTLNGTCTLDFWELGLSGLMVDFGERIEEDMVFSNGISGDEMHNLQGYYYTKAVRDAWEESKKAGDYILFARAGAAGSQKFGAIFGGDQEATFDGLQKAMHGGIAAGASGYAVWGSDIGALLGTPDEELYLRWLGFGAFSPIMRIHGNMGRDPWNFSEEAERTFQKYFWLRENLLDSIYSASLRAHHDGTPMMLAMGLAYPEHFDVGDEYLFCDSILVCPVYEAGVTEKDVTIPKGSWYHVWTGEKVVGNGRVMTVSAPVHQIPAFVKAGSVLPIAISPKTWKLMDSMQESKVQALLITPADADVEHASDWWISETEKKTYTSVANKGETVICSNQMDNPNKLLVHGLAVEKVFVDGEEQTQLPEKPTDSQCGFYVDAATHQTIISLPSKDWRKVQIL